MPSFGVRRSLKIAVLLGGPSAEREVSLESGREVIAALRRRGHHVEAIDPGVDLFSDQRFLQLADWRSFDVVFIALHGTFGEDGTVQRLLDGLGVPYTGSDAEASRVAFSKSAAKERFAAEGIASPPYVLAHECDPRSRIARHAATLGYPIVVKPDTQGSSLGVSVVERPDELPSSLERCFAFGPFGLLERYVAGQEWTVGFLGSDPLPPMCVTTPRPFLDFEAKYRDESTVVTFEPAVSPLIVESILRLATRAVQAVGASGACRVDLRLSERSVPCVLEVNTVPGFTPHSAVPTAADRAGLGFDELCERVVALALSDGALRQAA